MEEWKRRLRTARESKGLSKTAFAKAVGVSNPTATDWEKATGDGGIKEISGVKLVKVCEVLGIDTGWLLNGVSISPNVQPGTGQASAIRALHPDDPVPDDVVLVPESKVEFSAGPGRVPIYELVEENEPATYRRSWFQKEGINPDRVRRFRVSGDSQEPFLFNRDTILVNLDETEVVDGRLYAIRYENDLRVKFLFRRLDGTLILRSMNQAYLDEEVPPELVNEHISIIGRVRDKSGKGGL